MGAGFPPVDPSPVGSTTDFTGMYQSMRKAPTAIVTCGGLIPSRDYFNSLSVARSSGQSSQQLWLDRALEIVLRNPNDVHIPRAQGGKHRGF